MNKYIQNLLKLSFTLSRIFPSFIAVHMAEKLFTTPFRSNRREVELELLKTADKFNILSNNNDKISAYRWGNKADPIVLFVHGWASTGTCFIKFIELLVADGYQVVSYDSIAHGDTRGTSSASVTQWADTVLSMIHEVGDVHCIVGHSLGAGAIIVASSFKLNTQKIVLISPATNIIKLTETFADFFSIPLKTIRKMQHYAWQKYNSSASKYGNNWQEIFESTIKEPILIIHDKDDSEIDIRETRKFAAKILQAKFIETNKLGHRRILLNPHIIKTTINFINAKE